MNRLRVLAFSVLSLTWFSGAVAVGADAPDADRKARYEQYAAILGEVQEALDDENLELAQRKLLSTDSELRGWEFAYLSRKSKGDKVQWTPPVAGEVKGRVSCMAFTACSKYLILARESTEVASGSVSVWDFIKEEVVPFETVEGSHLTTVARSPDGKTVAAAGARGKIVLWDAETGKALRQYSGHNPGLGKSLSSKNLLTIRSLDFGPNGKRIVSSAGPAAGVKCVNALKLWSVETGETLMTIEGDHQAGKARPILSVSFNPDGKTLASGGFDGAITLWDARTGKELRRINGPFVNILDLEFSPDGKWLACGSVNSAIWDVDSGKQVARLLGYPKPVSSLAFSPDGERLVTGGWDRTVRIWDAKTGVELLTIGALNNRVNSVAFSADGESIAAGGPEGRAIPKPTIWSHKTE